MTESWTAHIANLGSRSGWRYRFQEPPADERLAEAQAALDTHFPSDLLALYRETDGVYALDGEWYPIWTIEDLVNENLRAYENDPTPREQYVGFGDDGTGDPYCVRREGGDAIYHFSNIELAARRLAENLSSWWGRDGSD